MLIAAISITIRMEDGIIGNNAIKIKSVQAANLYKVDNHYKYKKDDLWIVSSYIKFGQAVIHDSIFAKYVIRHGVTVNKKGASDDFIMMQFDNMVYEDDSDKNEIKPSLTSQELRDYYYENGAKITYRTFDKNKNEILNKRKSVCYKMLYRSPGKAKEGHCVFVREQLHSKFLNYLTMGLWEKMPNTIGADIVGLSAYAPLITATAVDYIQIPMESIFVVKDEEVSIEKKALTVTSRKAVYKKYVPDYDSIEESINQSGFTFYKKKVKANPCLKYIKKRKKSLEEIGIKTDDIPKKEREYTKDECYVDRSGGKKQITNILWDGMGIIDSSIFPKDKEGFIYCRSHFFKSCLFRGNIQEYFKDNCDNYEEEYATDYMGRKLKISDIKVIITENSLKWVKFVGMISKKSSLSVGFNYYEQKMKKDGEWFAIVKSAHDSKYGDVQRSSFQINNTIPTTDRKDLEEISENTIQYFNRLKTDNKAFIDYLRITGTKKYSINNVLCDLYQINNDFVYTEYFKKKKTAVLSDLKSELKRGKLFQNGNNLTICGNPIAMLMKVIGKDFMEEKCFQRIEDGIQCYTGRYEEGEHIAAFRSPHNAFHNIVHLENVYPEPVKKYFPDLGNNVIIINGIHTDVQSRLNGQDLDTDFVFTTNQRKMVKYAREAYLKYPTIINAIQSNKSSRYDKSMRSYSEMDSIISKSQYAIGDASNKAQLALSYYFDSGCQSEELEDVFVICSVLAQLAIDGAKKNFDVKVSSELNRIARMPCMDRTNKIKYPQFYADVQKYNNIKRRKQGKRMYSIPEEEVGFLNCPMDIIYSILEEKLIDLRNCKELNTKTIYNLNTVFEYDAKKINKNKRQYREIIDIVKSFQKDVDDLNIIYDITSDSYSEQREFMFDNCMKQLQRKTIKEDTMKTLVAYAFKSGNEYLRDTLLTVLYDKNKKEFLKCFKSSKKCTLKVS